jgi:type IV pilus assembly protein PilC
MLQKIKIYLEESFINNWKQFKNRFFFINFICSCINRLFKQIKIQEFFIFNRQIARLLQAGIPLLQILVLLENTATNTVLKQYLKRIIANLEDGFSLSEALQKNQSYFSKFHCSLIQLGEKTATLGLMFDRIAAHQEKYIKLRGKIIKALIYPIIVLMIAMLVFVGLLVEVVPQFEQFFLDAGADLPFLTRIIIYLSRHIGFFCFNFGFVLFLLGIFFTFFKKKYPNINRKIDYYILKIPILNKLFSNIIIARITRALSTALEANLPLVDALHLIAEISGNFVYKSAILLSCDCIRNGEGFYQAFSRRKLFPLDLLQLIKIGEISNCLCEMLNNIADIYEEKMNYFAEYLSIVLEPILIVILGLMVACLVIAMYLPIFKLGSVI